jgi:DNA-binding LacI/PurR family transcriptional regulator
MDSWYAHPAWPMKNFLPLLKHHAAVVVFDRTIDQAVGCSVRVNDIYGGIVGTSHLIQNGRRRLALLAGPHYYSGGNQRRYGFRLALEAAGINSAE